MGLRLTDVPARVAPILDLRRADTAFPGAVAAMLGGAAIVAVVGVMLGGRFGVATAEALYAAGCAAILAGLRATYPHRAFGLCNTITLTRLALTAALCVPLVTPGTPSDEVLWAAFAVASLSLAMDGIDGWAARRAGLASGFGARFDVEVDSAFALVLALIAWESGKAGIWVMALGLPRYAFWAAGAAWPWLRGPLPERFSRKAVCVVQIGVLVALLLPPVTAPLSTVLAVAAIAAVAWSFAVDIRHLAAARR